MMKCVSLLAVLGMLAAVPGTAPAASKVTAGDPYADIAQMQSAFASARSYRARVSGSMMHGANTLDHVAPDRWRERMDGGKIDVITIGATSYQKFGPKWLVFPGAGGLVTIAISQARDFAMTGDPHAYAIKLVSKRSANEEALRVYSFDRRDGTMKAKIWVNDEQLPQKIEATTAHGTLTITYSHFNSAPAIEAPKISL